MGGPKSVRIRRPFRLRFWRNQGGATAVEFAIVALPFLALMAGIVELGFLFLGAVSLDNAMASASRRIRTGELQTPGTTAAPATAAQKEITRQAFRDEVCNGMGFLAADCIAKLSIDVQTVTSFTAMTMTNPVSGGTFNAGTQHFETGGPSAYVMVTAYYRWTLFMPLMNQALEKLPGETVLTSVTAFANEPF
jgi:Flp pilus assembly protein TadG